VAYRWQLLPASGMYDAAMYDLMSPAEQLRDRARHLVLPWLALTLVGTAIFARFQRAAMHDTRRAPFVRTLAAKGLADRAIFRRVWRASILPVVTVAGLYFPALVTGAVFVERVFAWPGMGSTLIGAISARDHILVSACVVVGSVLTVVGSLLADVVRAVLDPRVEAR
jgi:peptide/nickel transport system permease protein